MCLTFYMTSNTTATSTRRPFADRSEFQLGFLLASPVFRRMAKRELDLRNAAAKSEVAK